MKAVFLRELRNYFITPVGFIYLTVFVFFAGFYFSGYCLISGSSELSAVFSNLFLICIFLIPILTMRLLSEDRKNKTDQLLLTAPLSLYGLVFGKFTAALTIFTAGSCVFFLLGGILSFLSSPNWPMLAGNLIGLLLLGAALIAMGTFISSLTESQVVAAISSFAFGLFLLITDAAVSMVAHPVLQEILRFLSFNRHYSKFTQGILPLEDIIFFLSTTFFFLFLTVSVFERRRWK